MQHLREAWRKLAWQGERSEQELRDILYGTQMPHRDSGPMSLDAATNLLRRILRAENFPQADEAYVQRGDKPNSAMIGWDFDTSPPIPFIHAGPGTPDGLTVIHEAAHIIQNRGARPNGWAEAHSQAWLDIFTRLLRQWGSRELAYDLERMTATRKQSEWREPVPWVVAWQDADGNGSYTPVMGINFAEAMRNFRYLFGPEAEVLYVYEDFEQDERVAVRKLATPQPKDAVPLPPGETPLPPGTVRAFHFTQAKNEDSIRQHGLRMSNAQGASYGEGRGIWFDAHPNSWGSIEDRGALLLEVALPADTVVLNGGFATTFVIGVDVPPEQIIAMHVSWHQRYRYLLDYAAEVRAGEYDDLVGDMPDYAKAIEKIKRETR